MQNFDPQKTIVIEILSFDGAELETIRNGHRSFVTAGTLNVLYFRDYHRFILSMNDWKYVLFDQSPIIKASSSYSLPVIYNIPLNEGFFYSLRLSKVPHIEAVKNLETIFSNIAYFTIEIDLDKENLNPRTTFKENLYGQWDNNLPDITPGGHLEGSDSKLSKLGVVKRGIIKATDQLARGLITMQTNNVNLTQIRDFHALINSTQDDAPHELLWRKDVEDLILHDCQFGHQQKEQHSIGERLKEGIHDIRQRLSFKSPVQEDVFQSRHEESLIQPGVIDRFKDKLHLRTSAEKNAIEEEPEDKRTVTEVLHGIKENIVWKFNDKFQHKHETSADYHHHQPGFIDTIKRKLSAGGTSLSGTTAEGSDLDPNKTRGMEILYFEGVELERTKNNVHSFQTVGTLRVLFFEDYSRFILFLGDWAYALLQDMSIVKTSPNYIDPVIYKLSTNEGSFTLRITKVPYIQAIQNLETIFMKNTSYSTSEEAYEFGRPSISRTQLYGMEPESFEGSLSVKTNEMMSEDERLGRIDVVKREILKTTDKIITGLTPNKAENMNLVRIRDYQTLLNPSEDSDVRIISKSRADIEKIIIETQEMAHKMRETSTTADYEGSERRSVVNSLKEGFEDLKTVLATTCRSSNAEKNYELIIDQDRRATRVAQERREHPGIMHRIKDKFIEGDISLAEKIKNMMPHREHHVASEAQGYEQPGMIDRLKTRIPDMLHMHRDRTPTFGGQEQLSAIDNTYLTATGALERQEILRRTDYLGTRDTGYSRRSYALDDIRGFNLVDSTRQGQDFGLENANKAVFYTPESQGFSTFGQSYEPLYHYEG